MNHNLYLSHYPLGRDATGRGAGQTSSSATT